jgi:Na+-transporting methylmalonyl-CoA/oxaloacetate decarboxylase gamma subunit
MISGMAIVFAALALLSGAGQRFAFALAGFAVELLGLGVLAYAYRSLQAAARR